jgi:hypothetical protein
VSNEKRERERICWKGIREPGTGLMLKVPRYEGTERNLALGLRTCVMDDMERDLNREGREAAPECLTLEKTVGPD